MSLLIEQFDDYFEALWNVSPFPWQSRLAKLVFKQGWPECIDLPTASGKTACMDIAVFVLACQAGHPTNQRTVGRRIYFTVNRRIIVDEAFDRARSLAQNLLDAKDGILREVADALRQISGEKHAPPLDIAQLRGGIFRDRAWARSITQPIVVCTTADQLGSRLLFRGYGVSPSMQPVHAALTACDSLILLDEAHVTRAFSQTLGLLSRYRQLDKAGPPLQFVQMTATPVHVNDRFQLDENDHLHPIIKARQEALKPAALVKLDKKKPINEEIVKRAFEALSDTRRAVGIIVNRVQTARDIEAMIRTRLFKDEKAAEVHLVIGRMRPIDRDDLQEKLRSLVGPDRPEVLDTPAFVVATQCLEVGADYDFDVLITECASVDALRQRFGRLNRKGRPIEAAAAIVTNDESIKGGDPIYGDAIKHTWEWLTENKRTSIDFGIAAFKTLWDTIDDAKRQAMLSPAPDAAVLLPAHLDALCQTSPRPVPSPDVGFFIHGPMRDMAEVNVCWRAIWAQMTKPRKETGPRSSDCSHRHHRSAWPSRSETSGVGCSMCQPGTKMIAMPTCRSRAMPRIPSKTSKHSRTPAASFYGAAPRRALWLALPAISTPATRSSFARRTSDGRRWVTSPMRRHLMRSTHVMATATKPVQLRERNSSVAGTGSMSRSEQRGRQGSASSGESTMCSVIQRLCAGSPTRLYVRSSSS